MNTMMYVTGTPARDSLLVLKALKLLETKGWGKDQFHNPDTGCYCARGALRAVAGEDADLVSLALRLPPYPVGLTRWNDAPERTFDEVRARFQQVAIELLEEAITQRAAGVGHGAY